MSYIYIYMSLSTINQLYEPLSRDPYVYLGYGAGEIINGLNNIAIGNGAMKTCVSGNNNIAIGLNAGNDVANPNNNIFIGNTGVALDNGSIRLGESGIHVKNFQSGIRGVTTVIADAIPVLVDSGHQLGTVSSDRRLKDNITYDFGDTKTIIESLKPCKFSYKTDKTNKLVMGCIADEFKTVLPEYVVKNNTSKEDKEGFETIQYQFLPILILKEMQRMIKEIDTLKTEVNSLKSENNSLKTEVNILKIKK